VEFPEEIDLAPFVRDRLEQGQQVQALRNLRPRRSDSPFWTLRRSAVLGRTRASCLVRVQGFKRNHKAA
jgi:hypothetical protein